MNEQPRDLVAADPSFFSGVIIETHAIASHAAAIRAKTERIEAAIGVSVQEHSVALLKAAVDLNNSVGRELQADVDRLRGLISLLDKKLAAHQSRRPRFPK